MQNPTSDSVWHDWLEWLQTPLGRVVCNHEQDDLLSLKGQISGDHVLWMGIPSLSSFPAWHQHQSFFICPDSSLSVNFPDISRIQGNTEALPFLPESIDIAILPHTLELISDPEQLLREVYTVLNPYGYVIIFGFNPWSWCGIRRLLHLGKRFPHQGTLYTTSRLKDWLKILNFEIIDETRSFYRPPVNHEKFLRVSKFLEPVGRHTLWFFGGLYMIVARKKVFGTTPLRLKWEQWSDIVSKGMAEPVRSEVFQKE